MPKVRFAPSPTGYLHIGGARTALFNWLYAKVTGGIFVLRIEDTDLERSKPEYTDKIIESMKWLGLDWDEFYKQSDRFNLYREHAQRLVEEGKAYKDGEAVFLKMTKKQLKVYDLVRGEVDFDTANFIQVDEDKKPILDEKGEPKLRDEVLIKSDGSPAYSFCCAIDDSLMEITHVIRGEDHISNTPRQLMIYDALGFKPPKYGHLPLIMGTDGSRLSKRDGAVDVMEYKANGFVPQALVNYLVLLGWNPGNNQEVFTTDQMIKSFSIKKVNKAAAAFSMEKLTWVNSQHLRNMETDEVIPLVLPLLEAKGYAVGALNGDWLKNVVDLFKGRLFTLGDFIQWTDYLFTDDFDIEQDAWKEHVSVDKKDAFVKFADSFENLTEFTAESIEQSFKNVIEELGMKVKDMVHPVRIAVTGRAVGPSLFHCLSLLDQDKVVSRLRKAIS